MLKEATEMVRHPAKYTDDFIPIFSSILIANNCKKIIDPFAGTGKIGEIKNNGFDGLVYSNEIEEEWILPNTYSCDVITCMDAEDLLKVYSEESFDAIVTSPTYGNRMADHHNARDGSIRNTYTHCMGRQLSDGNTGKMQWGDEYRNKHKAIYRNICKLVKKGGLFILNISNHIRKGQEIDVCDFHKDQIVLNGYRLEDDLKIQTRRNRFGQNASARCDCEHIYVLRRER